MPHKISTASTTPRNIGMQMTREYLFDKVIEAHKLRNAVQLGLLVALITVLQYNIDKKSIVLFCISFAIPALALLIDLITKFTYISPFLYKGLSKCKEELNDEPIELLFLSYGNEKSIFANVIIDPALLNYERQRAFRRAYTFRHVWFKLGFYAVFMAAVWFYYKSVMVIP